MNHEFEERRASRADSISSRVWTQISNNLALYVIAGIFAVISFIAISTSSEYHTFRSAMANGIGAALIFGVIAYGVGVIVRKCVRLAAARRRTSDSGVNTEPLIDRDSANFPNTEPWIPRDGRSTSAASSTSFVQVRSEYMFSFNDLHPWVRSAAQSHWDNESYRDAVEHAARSVNEETRQKAWSYKDGTDLMNYVFGMEAPTPDGRRLRFRGDPKTQTWKNRMMAGQALGRACTLGLRNVAAHENKLQWSRQVAFQYLVMFSVLAEWIDECDVSGV